MNRLILGAIKFYLALKPKCELFVHIWTKGMHIGEAPIDSKMIAWLMTWNPQKRDVKRLCLGLKQATLLKKQNLWRFGLRLKQTIAAQLPMISHPTTHSTATLYPLVWRENWTWDLSIQLSLNPTLNLGQEWNPIGHTLYLLVWRGNWAGDLSY